MLKLDMKTYDTIYKTEGYKEATQRFEKALSELQPNEQIKIEETVVFLETVVTDLTYQKAFHDGMRFILDAMTGKNVIEL